MSHDFLTSLHSSVISVTDGKSLTSPQGVKEATANKSEQPLINQDDRHRTVGVSMSPQLRSRAAKRARALGLPFSRYVQWCVEAELDGSSLGDRFKV